MISNTDKTKLKQSFYGFVYRPVREDSRAFMLLDNKPQEATFVFSGSLDTETSKLTFTIQSTQLRQLK